MTILFDATKLVKTARPFGLGIARPDRDRFAASRPTPEDAAWAADRLNQGANCYEYAGPSDAELDRMAGEAAWIVATSAGFYPAC